MKTADSAIYLSRFVTSHGIGMVIGAKHGIQAVLLPGDLSAGTVPEGCSGESCLTRQAADLLERYYRGEIVDLRLPYHIEGLSEFRRRVYAFVSAIPFGSISTYGEVAEAVGSPSGARGVGGAMGTNPIPLLIPCHRVVGSDGALTGYSASGGIEIKRKLLEMEGVLLAPNGRVLLSKRKNGTEQG